MEALQILRSSFRGLSDDDNPGDDVNDVDLDEEEIDDEEEEDSKFKEEDDEPADAE